MDIRINRKSKKWKSTGKIKSVPIEKFIKKFTSINL